MKNLVLILVFTALLPFLGLAQSTVLQSDDGTEDSLPKSKVLVIPFHTLRYYFSDCDKQVGQVSKIEQKDIRKAYQLGFDYATEATMEERYEPINLAQMKDSVDVAALDEFYDNVSYAYDAPNRNVSKQQNALLKAMQGARKGIGSSEKRATLNEMDSYVTVDAKEKEYMKLSWKNDEFLSKLNTLYAPDYIVTINQFEIKTDYQHCIDRDLGKYARQIKIHYNVFSPEGKQLFGDVVVARYNSTSDDINKIIQDNFGFLSEYVMKSLPGRK